MKYLKLNTNLKSGFIWSVSIIIVGIVILIITLNLKIYQFTNPIQIQYINVIFISSILEEITFRGFILNKLNEISSFWYANIITSILFVVIHIPGWIIINETIILYDMIQLIISIFIISIILGWVMHKSGSLYPAIILHAINNYFSILL
ncbi:lysostaphin resistance A-like protein [Thermoplasmatota archaeon]